MPPPLPQVGYRGCRNEDRPRPPYGSPGLRPRFPLPKPVGGPNIALHAVFAFMASSSTYLVTAFPAHSTSFFSKFPQSSTVECVLNSQSECLLVGIHLVSP